MLGKLGKWLKGLRKKSIQPYQTAWQGDYLITTGSTDSTTSAMNNPTNYPTSSPTVYFQEKELPKDERIVKKPLEVVKDVIGEEPKMNLVDLKTQIRLVNRRMRCLEECDVVPSDEREALVYLKARLKYAKYGKLFRWAVATNERIDALLKMYKLSKVSFKSYYKSVPMEAVDELEKFIKAWRKVRDGEPEFRLIIDDGGEEHKKDPILLASSPFGKWWYVCGAWDKEVQYVDDIIYKGK